MAWILLVVAGLLEIVWAFTMKLSHGFTRPGPSIVTLLAMLASFALLAASMRMLPLGTAYTVWTGIGAVGAFIVGVASTSVDELRVKYLSDDVAIVHAVMTCPDRQRSRRSQSQARARPSSLSWFTTLLTVGCVRPLTTPTWYSTRKRT